jgi:hypothetical protein
VMILTPEIAGLAASVLGVLGLILRKARCFIRRFGNSWDGGVGSCDATIVPPFQKASHIVNPVCDQKSPRTPDIDLQARASTNSCRPAVR